AFWAFDGAEDRPVELQTLTSVIDAGLRETDRARVARKQVNTPFYATTPRDLIAIINSARYHGIFARRCLKQRVQRGPAQIPPLI
ncbi:hypothetical protein NS115_24945, partial [Paenibacillus jamilae]